MLFVFLWEIFEVRQPWFIEDAGAGNLYTSFVGWTLYYSSRPRWCRLADPWNPLWPSLKTLAIIASKLFALWVSLLVQIACKMLWSQGKYFHTKHTNPSLGLFRLPIKSCIVLNHANCPLHVQYYEHNEKMRDIWQKDSRCESKHCPARFFMTHGLISPAKLRRVFFILYF